MQCFTRARDLDPCVYKVETHWTQWIWERNLIIKTLLGIAAHYAYPQLPRETHSRHPAVTEISHYAVKLHCWDHICIIKWIRVLLKKKAVPQFWPPCPKWGQMWPANVRGPLTIQKWLNPQLSVTVNQTCTGVYKMQCKGGLTEVLH